MYIIHIIKALCIINVYNFSSKHTFTSLFASFVIFFIKTPFISLMKMLFIDLVFNVLMIMIITCITFCTCIFIFTLLYNFLYCMMYYIVNVFFYRLSLSSGFMYTLFKRYPCSIPLSKAIFHFSLIWGVTYIPINIIQVGFICPSDTLYTLACAFQYGYSYWGNSFMGRLLPSFFCL